MEIIIRIAAGVAVALAVFAAGCSAMLSGATSDAVGVLEARAAETLVGDRPG